jgi:4-amino-4-deoxy-L-arabinose transferase-like glycosyltransferase
MKLDRERNTSMDADTAYYPSKISQPGRRDAAIVLASIFAVALLLRSQVAAIPLDRDEGEYAYTSQLWLQGDVPYKNAFDQKPPGVFAVYAVIQTLFGESPVAIHWATQFYTFGTITCVFLLGRKLYSFPVGAGAAGLFAFMATNACVMGNSSNTELFMVLPMTAALLTTLLSVERDSRKWALVAGVLAMAALLFKQVALPNFLFSALYLLLFARRRLRAAGIFLVGAATMLIPVCGYFFVAGALHEFYDCIIGFNLNYGTRLAFSEYPHAFWYNFKWILKVNWLIYFFAAVGIFGCLWDLWRKFMGSRHTSRLIPSQSSRNEPTPFCREDVTLVAWTICCIAGLSTGGYFREHYFVQGLPALALLASRGMARAILTVSERSRIAAWFLSASPNHLRPQIRRDVSIYAVCTLAIMIGLATEWWYYLPGSVGAKCQWIYGLSPFPESPAIAEYIVRSSNPDDTVYIFGSEPQILYYAHRKSASRYFFVQPVMFPTLKVPGQDRMRQREILDVLHSRPPKFILTEFVPLSFVSFANTPFDIFVGVREMLQHSYHVAAAVLTGEVGRRRLVAGPQVAKMWEQAPYWYDVPPDYWWGIMVIWERNDAVPSSPIPTNRGMPTSQ